MEPVDSHKDACTDCGLCIEVCQVYDDSGMVKKFYDHIEGGSASIRA
ncbi:MAG TPA: 4Fe-4S binding protein [Methanomassiliicoccales archaeon]|nr:4Fe-4S binding protein [Methanomassiliicoccales archaeon]